MSGIVVFSSTLLRWDAYSHSLQPIYVHVACFKPCKRRLGVTHAAICHSWEPHRETAVTQRRASGSVGGGWQIRGEIAWLGVVRALKIA